jgi:TonB-linked SusC/RagA family outer membrane protein
MSARLGVFGALCATLLAAAPAAAQESSVAGTVTDQANVAVPAAQVVVRGTRNGATTDANGRFRITGLPQAAGANITLIARRIGYRSDSVQVTAGDENVHIVLAASAVSLNEVVVTGTPGATSKRQLGVTVAQITAPEVVAKAPVTDVQQLLNGRASGVTLLNNSGVVGAGTTVRIRGSSSLSLTNQPLIYVDGVRVDNTQSTGTGNQAFGANTTTRWNDFDPQDIESIEIVKGPAATTLYGTEAANGVIQIITKKGAQGKTTWDFNMRQGANWFSNPQGRLWTNYDVNSAGDTVSENYTQLEKQYGKPIFTTGHLQNYSLGVGGGSQRVTYHVSGSWDRNEGVESSNNQNQYQGRASVSFFPTDKIDITANAGYIAGKTNLAAEAGFGGTTWTTYFMDPATIGTPHLGFLSGTPDAYHTNYNLFQAIDRFTGSVTMNHRPAKWFNQRLTFGVDQGYEDSEELGGVHHELSYFFDTDADSGYKVVDTRNTRLFTASYAGNFVFPVTSTLQSTTSIGGDLIKRTAKYVNGFGADFPAPGLTALSSTTARQTSQETDTLNNTVGLFAQEQVGWRDRLFLTVGARMDDNSSFGKNFNHTFYPKVSGSWVLSEEPFFHLPAVSTLKLRAAYGESGQSPLPYTANSSFGPVPGPFGAAVTPVNIGNPSLGPERSYQTELGFDAGLFQERAGIEFTFYTGGTRDAILQKQVPPSLGYPGFQYVNAGKITKHGIELALRGTPVQSTNTQWDLGLNLGTTSDKVEDLGGLAFIQASTNVRHVVGYPIGGWWSRKVVGGIRDSTGNIASKDALCDDGTSAHNAIPCSQAPNVYLGRTVPNFEGSATSTLRFLKNFSLFAMVDTKRGYKKLDGNARVRCHIFAECRSNWYPNEYDDVTVAAQSSSSYYSDIINDASFVRLREVSLSYSLPERFAALAHASGATLSVAGRNLKTWTKYPGLDPEASFQGGSRGFGQWEQDVTPQLMQFVTTLHLTF